MPWKIEPSVSKTHFIATFWGNCTAKDLYDSGVEFSRLSDENGILNALIDATTMIPVGPTSLEHYQLVEYVFGTNPNRPKWKIAILRSSDKEVQKINHFFETLCINRGIRTKVFNTREAALEWFYASKRQN